MRRQTPNLRTAILRSARFTLLELILVLALMALVLGLAAPMLRGFLHGRTTVEEARRLLAYSREAATEAVSRGDACDLWIDPGSGSYGLKYRSGMRDPNIGLQTRTVPRSVVLSLVVDGRPQTAKQTLTWYPDGALDAGGLQSITVASREDANDNVTLVPDDASTRLIVQTQDTQP